MGTSALTLWLCRGSAVPTEAERMLPRGCRLKLPTSYCDLETHIIYVRTLYDRTISFLLLSKNERTSLHFSIFYNKSRYDKLFFDRLCVKFTSRTRRIIDTKIAYATRVWLFSHISWIIYYLNICQLVFRMKI